MELEIQPPCYLMRIFPYGYMNKAELLNAIGSKGQWNKWSLEKYGLGFKERRINTNTINTGKIYRLNNFNKNYGFALQWQARQLGIIKLDQIIQRDFYNVSVYNINKFIILISYCDVYSDYIDECINRFFSKTMITTKLL